MHFSNREKSKRQTTAAESVKNFLQRGVHHQHASPLKRRRFLLD